MLDVTAGSLPLHRKIADIKASVAENGADQALKRLDELLADEETDEHRVFVYWIRARITEESKGVPAAVADFDKAIDLADDKLVPGILYELGVCWRYAGEHGEAETVLRRAAEHATQLEQWGIVARAIEHLSGMAGDKESFDAARDLALEADEAWAKTNELAERGRGLRRLGELEAKRGELENAKEAFRAASWLYASAGETRSNIEVQCQLSNVLTKLGDEKEAIEVARDAARFAEALSPEALPSALYALALSLDDNKKFWVESEETFARCYSEALSRNELQIAAQSSGDLAGLLAGQERFEESLVWNGRSERHYADVGNALGSMVCALNSAAFQAHLGHKDERVSSLRRAFEQARTAGADEYIPEISRLLAEALGTPDALVESLVFLFDSVHRGLLKQAATPQEYDEQGRAFIEGVLDKLVEVTEEEEQALGMAIRVVRSTTVKELTMSIGLAGHALERWKSLDSDLVPWLRLELGKLWARLGDHQAARALYIEAYDEAKRLGDANLQVGAAGNLALSCQELNLVDEAERVLQETIPVAKTETEADSLRLNLASNYMRVWDFDRAEPLLETVLSGARKRGDSALIAASAGNLASVLADTGREGQALDYLTLVDENMAGIAVHQVPDLFRLKAGVLERAGEPEAAMAAYEEMANLADEQQQGLSTPRLQTVYLASRQHYFPPAVELAIKTDPAKGLYLAEVGRARAMAQSISGPGNTHSVPRDMADRLRARLAADEAAVAYYLMDDHLIIWRVSSEGVAVDTIEVSGEEIERLAVEYRLSMDGDSENHALQRQLSAHLVEPIRDWLGGYKTIYISPHGPLHNMPFSALGEDERLVQTHDIGVVPALHLLDQKPGWNTSWKGAPLIIGDPSGNLPSAADEAKAIAAKFDKSILLLGAEATKEELSKRLPEASLLHLACHAGFDFENPFDSGVKLASSDSGGELLSLAEIFRLEGVPKLVVLSACETRLAALSLADDPVGVAQAFLIAGAETAVASLWPVSDAVTAELMRSFYGALETMTPIGALAHAQRELDMGPVHDASGWSAFTAYTVASNRRVRKRGRNRLLSPAHLSD